MKTWRVAFFALFMMLLFGCIPEAKCPTPTTCQTTYVFRVDPKFTPAEKIRLQAGMDAWRFASHDRLCFIEVRKPEKGWTFVILRFETQEGLAPFVDEYQDYAAIYHTGVVGIAMDKALPALEGTIAHEIGHLLGYEHNPNPKSVMFKAAHPLGTHLNDDDVKQYVAHRYR